MCDHKFSPAINLPIEILRYGDVTETFLRLKQHACMTVSIVRDRQVPRGANSRIRLILRSCRRVDHRVFFSQRQRHDRASHVRSGIGRALHTRSCIRSPSVNHPRRSRAYQSRIMFIRTLIATRASYKSKSARWMETRRADVERWKDPTRTETKYEPRRAYMRTYTRATRTATRHAGVSCSSGLG